MPLDVIGFGAMNLDEIARVERLTINGETRVRSFVRRPGGSAANTIYALARLGMRAGFVGAVGDDAAGRLLVADLVQAGVDTKQVAVKRGEASGFVWAIADARNRSLNVYPGANDLLERRDIRLAYLRGARLLHLSSFVNAEQLALQIWAIRQLPVSVRISFAPGSLYADRGVAALRPILERTAVLFLNVEEARRLTRRSDPRSAAQELIRLGSRTVVITLGEGMEVRRAERRAPRRTVRRVRAACFITDGRAEELLKPISPSRVAVDSVGAGDAFAAGFLYGTLNNRPLLECARLGQVAAHCSLRAPGARDALPDQRQLQRAYRRLFGTILE